MCEEWKIPRKSHFHSSELILFPRFPGNGNDFFGNPEEKSQKLISICSNFPKNEGKSKKWECSGNEEFSGKISYSAGIWRDWEKDYKIVQFAGMSHFHPKLRFEHLWLGTNICQNWVDQNDLILLILKALFSIFITNVSLPQRWDY